jgi:glycosyltransferase involved in cell wall biosynthesis
MNILHITTYLQGGAGKVIVALAKNQTKQGNKVFVITSKTDEEAYCNYKQYLKDLKEANVKVLEVDSTFKRDIYLNMKVIEKLHRVLEAEEVDIIHSHAAIPSLISIVSKNGLNRNIPIIQTMHGWGVNKKYEHEFVDINIMNLIDKVITVSISDNLLLEKKGVEKSKLDYIYNGIDEEVLVNEENIMAEDIIKLKEQGFFIFGCVGSIGYRKNQKLLLEAANNIEHKIAVVLIGEFEDKENFKITIEKCNKKVLALGYKENANQYMKHFDALVLPSRSEGLPITVIEAFKEKVPVVCSSIDGCLEIVEDYKNGLIFKENNLDDLVRALKEMIKIDKNNMIEQAYERYLKDFTQKKMMKNYERHYIDLQD